MLDLPDYQDIRSIYSGNETLVYRAIRTKDRQPVVIKVLRNSHPSFNELVQFRNEYAIAQDLQHPHIVQPLALERYGNSYALIMPDSGAIALDQYWQPSEYSLTQVITLVITLAIQLAEALQYLTVQRIIHKDIKPANIIINPDSQQVQLIDFSISSLLPKEQQQLLNPNVLEGSLPYISPEQTGRMNRGIDYRTDFYSLGITLFELLTGNLPFVSDDPMELVHCHIAQTAKFPDDSQVPAIVQAIVLKLMDKNAEDRYQSALGLKHDLEQCQQQLDSRGEITAFELGKRDLCDRFIIPEKLYGRETEVHHLLNAFDRVAQGTTELMLVAGFSGIGKTAVVNEVHKPIVKQRGYFIKGKYDQFNRNIPFSAFVQAFRDLMGQLLGESDQKLENWKTKILHTVGDNGQVLIEVIPELAQIIGQQPSVPELEGNAAQNRFNLLFSQFVHIFTTKEHPLVIFLDDLQWADSASLNLLKVLIDESGTGYLLLLGAYRDNEVFPAHPLMVQLEQLEQNQAVISTIILDVLAQHHINQLIAETLSCDLDISQSLTNLVYQQTKGNPFFTTQFIKGLYDEKLLKFNREKGYWEWDITEIYNASPADDVVQFMSRRLRKFPESTQNRLKLAACIGNQFDLETLAVVSEESKEEVATDLWEALQEGLVLPISENYKFFQKSNLEEKPEETMVLVGYRFLHDRVQQAAYSLISEDEKQATHLKIGRQLWHNLSEGEIEEQLFNIVNHLNAGRDLISERIEREEVAQLNLQASQKAKASVAYEASRRYCYEGQKFLDEATREHNYELDFALAIATIETEHLNSDLIEAKKLCESTLERAKTLLDRTKVRGLEIVFATNENKMNEAIDLARQVLVPLGINLPDDVDQIQAEIETLYREVDVPLTNIANLENLEIINDEEKLAVISILLNVGAAAYIARPTIYPLIMLHGTRYCLQYGNSALAAPIYTWHGGILCGTYDDIEAGYAFGKLSIKLIEKLDARAFETKVRNMFNLFIRTWKEPLINAVEDYPETIETGFNNGDLEYASYACMHLSNYSFLSGVPLDRVYQTQQRYLPETIKSKYEFSENGIRVYHQATANLLGENHDPTVLQGSILDGDRKIAEWEENNIEQLVFFCYEVQTQLLYLFEDYVKAVECGKKAWPCRGSVISTPYVPDYYFYYNLALLAKGDLTAEQEEFIIFSQDRLKMWAGFSPDNFQHKYDLVEAERYRLLDNKIEAIEYYDRAISGAKKYGFLQEEALANERAAKFYLNWDKPKLAVPYMTEAYYGYVNWGAKAKIDQLEAKYSQLLAPIIHATLSESAIVPPKSQDLIVTSTETSEALDLTTTIKASQVLSEEISLNALLTKLMQIAIENAGANQGTLLLNNSEDWEITAQYINGNCDLATIDLDQADNLPTSIINTVKRTEETLLIDNLADNHPFTTDPYLLQQPPQSLFCTPILNQGQLIGILYLENHLTPQAFTPDRIEVLNLLTTQAAISIKNARFYQTLEDRVAERTIQLAAANEEITQLNEKLTAENLRLGAELDIARRVQEMILPKHEELEAIAPLDIAGYMAPADEVGGDYYDVLMEEDVITIGIGDVTGHGLESGLVMMMAQTVVRTLQELRETDPIRFLNTVNVTLYKNVQRMGVDRNLTLAILNYVDGHLSISGQHEEVLVVRANGTLETLDTIDLGMTVGLIDDITEFVAQATLELQTGDGVVLYTDGIPEAENENGEFYGLERLCEMIQQNWDQSAQGILDTAIADLRTFIGSQKVFDDITLLVLKQQR